ncbi:MAG: DUF5104 domain-containing protein [Ruminococcus sp.]|nr:DUF5104 domain-containing protein [Ruminococcus sp.]
MKGLDSLPETFGFFSFIIPQAIIYLSIYNVGYNVCIFEKSNTASGLTPGIKYIKKASHDTKCFLATLKGKDIDTPLSNFSIIMTINNNDELEQQIQNCFDFLDGAITRYELEDITTSEHCDEESRELDFYCCYPKYLVKTDTNKEYSFTFCYHCLWTKHEDCTGIGSIRIEDKVSGESIAIGYFEYPYGDY